MKNKDKILIIDLETSLSVVATFGLYPDSIPHGNIIKDPHILCARWKFLGEDRVYGIKLTKKEILAGDDSRIAERLHRVVEDCSIFVAHNGDKFDLKYLKGRCLKAGTAPLNFIKTIDTLKVARQNFRLMSNRLDYLGTFLGVGNKLHTSSGLWFRVLEGDMKALKEMYDYNAQDVLLLEQVYLKLRPWIHNHPNLQVLLDDDKVCKACGSLHVHKHGKYAATQARKYQKFKCTNCGHVFKDNKCIKIES